MNSIKWLKSPEILVLEQKTQTALNLVHQVKRQVCSLNKKQAESWIHWPDNLRNTDIGDDAIRSLISGEFILPCDESDLQLNITEVDSFILTVGGNHAKWYSESPDLFVLFNTQQMSQNNPLIILGPYGSLCWRGVINGWSVEKIRTEALRVFGRDEVNPFLKRLIGLRFISEIPEFDRIHLSNEQITKEFLAPDIQYKLLHSRIPWYCLWEICTICDLRCKICYLPHFRSAGPNLKNAIQIAQQIIEAGVFYVSIMGGEPLLRGDLEKIIGHLRQAGVFVKVITNGQRLTVDRAKALADAGLNQIEISFDGLSAYTHDDSRGQSTYYHARRAVYNAQAASIPRVGIVWTVHTGNIKELTTLPRFILDLGIQECYISLFKKIGLFGLSAPFQCLDANAVQALQLQLSEWKQVFPKLIIALLPKCTCGRTSIVIGENGDVRLCPFFYEAIGNIYRTPLLDIWHSIEGIMLEDAPVGYCTNKKLQ